jgi:DNA-binding CsgD family transcriptional regulator
MLPRTINKVGAAARARRGRMGDTVAVAGERDRGRDAFRRQAWGEASTALAAADAESPLDLVDLERLATSLYLVGDDAGSTEAWTRAHHGWQRAGDPARAARCAFWLGFGLDITGDQAHAAGWYERARRLADEVGSDCVEQGYALVPRALHDLMVAGDAETARTAFDGITAAGERFGDADLVTLGRLGAGHALVLLGDKGTGMAMLDETMVSVVAGEVSPQLAGLVYCAVIEICHDTFDLRRARDWTHELTRWCAAQPDLEPYRGNCLVHRAEIMQFDGAWAEAMTEAERAYDLLSKPPGQMAVGDASYQRGELHRLRGEFAAAEEAYRQASHWGRPPQPGLALLRLAQGRGDAALTSIRRATDESQDRLARSKLLAAHAEIALAAADVAAARVAADELAAFAAELDTPLVRAVAAHAAGAVLLAEGDARTGLAELRSAYLAWQALGAPYESARTRVVIGLAYRALGDRDGAELELDAARAEFERLGAAPDAARARRLAGPSPPGPPGGLSRREVEVLALVATGRTNREIAADLVISDKTVARHVSNIFAKLGVSSRSGATAYAYEHDLAGPHYTQ